MANTFKVTLTVALLRLELWVLQWQLPLLMMVGLLLVHAHSTDSCAVTFSIVLLLVPKQLKEAATQLR